MCAVKASLNDIQNLHDHVAKQRQSIQDSAKVKHKWNYMNMLIDGLLTS